MGDIGLENFFWNSEKKITISHAGCRPTSWYRSNSSGSADSLTVCMHVNAVTLAELFVLLQFSQKLIKVEHLAPGENTSSSRTTESKHVKYWSERFRLNEIMNPLKIRSERQKIQVTVCTCICSLTCFLFPETCSTDTEPMQVRLQSDAVITHTVGQPTGRTSCQRCVS